MTIIDLGNNKVKVLPDIGKVLLDKRSNMKLEIAYCDEGEETNFVEIDL